MKRRHCLDCNKLDILYGNEINGASRCIDCYEKHIFDYERTSQMIFERRLYEYKDFNFKV